MWVLDASWDSNVVQSNLCHALCKMLHTIRVLAFVRQAACGHGFDHSLSYRIKSSGSDQNQDKHEHLVVCTEEFHRSTNWLCKTGSNHKLLLRNASLPSLICKPILRTISFHALISHRLQHSRCCFCCMTMIFYQGINFCTAVANSSLEWSDNLASLTPKAEGVHPFP